MNVELHIERLVLTGVPLPPGGRAAIAGAFSRELTRLIEADGLSPTLLGETSTTRLTATIGSPVSAQAGMGSRLGRNLARSVYSCLGPS